MKCFFDNTFKKLIFLCVIITLKIINLQCYGISQNNHYKYFNNPSFLEINNKFKTEVKSESKKEMSEDMKYENLFVILFYLKLLIKFYCNL